MKLKQDLKKVDSGPSSEGFVNHNKSAQAMILKC